MLHFGYEFGTVKIWQQANGEVRGQVTKPNITDELACAIICLAGPLAKQRLTGVPPERQPGAWDDLAKAKDMLSRVRGRGDNLSLDAIVSFTTMLVDSEWPMIQWLAAHLAERKQLSYDEVLQLIQAA
jgi:hypothetical protein